MINTTKQFETLRAEASDNAINALYLLNDYRGSSYICDAINERADSNIDIYHNDLFEWAKSHIAEIDEAAAEFGIPEERTIIGLIQQAQFLENERNLNEGLESALVIYAWQLAKDMIQEVTEEQADRLNAIDTVIDSCNRVEDIEAEVKEILEIED